MSQIVSQIQSAGLHLVIVLALVTAPPPLRRELGVLSRLASPIILTNVCWMLVGSVDLAMLGRMPNEAVKGEAVAAASLASVWVHLTQMLGMGIVMGIDPLVTQGHGARDREALGRALQRGIIVALLASIPVVVMRFYTAEFLSLTQSFAQWMAGSSKGEALAALDLENIDRLSAPAERYALAQTFATPFFLLFIAFRQQLQGRGILKPALIVALLANFVNFGANWVLIFELEMGILGAGLATGGTRVFMACALFFLVKKLRLLRGAWVPWDAESFRWSGITSTLRYGIPVGLHFAFEVGAFGTTTLLAGSLGVAATVAHTTAINLASMTFMIPLGIALAATTRVGNLVGEKRPLDAQRSATAALIMGAASMAALGIVLLVGRNVLPRIYVSDVDVIRMAATILPIAAAFQIFDGLQVVGSGILRGMGKTTAPAVFNFVAWWVIALPMAAWLVYRRGGTITSVWWALALGLGVVAVMMVLWVRYRGPASLASGLRAGLPKGLPEPP